MKKLKLRNIRIELSSITLRLYENPLLSLFRNLDESIYLNLEEKRKQ
jgi:hypothetical protein